ncbi:MAG: DUF5320 domain-containing protein [Candidatus Bathyarchaeota archaeon]|nr:DUF5320 domain-containing protein [Candidatus Bathyarchaeota archaeon]
MPRGDRTGPWGAGPMTGRAAGHCAGYSVPGFMNPIGGYGRGWGRERGRGFGRGWGRGFGRGWYVYPPPAVGQPAYPQAYPPVAQPQSPKQEVAALENYQKALEAEKADLEQEMGGVKARIEELKAKLK